MKKVDKMYGIKPPSNEEELHEVFGNPSEYKSPQAYWTAHGEFAFVRSPNYDHITFFRKHQGFWCHRLLKPVFEAVFEEIAAAGLAKEVKSYDGCYNHRLIRGSKTKLSMHSYGIALDINAFENRLGTEGNMHPGIVKVFKDNGFTWGGDFKGRLDPMHFEFFLRG